VAAAVSGSAVSITGAPTLVDVPVQVATDAAGDAPAPMIGIAPAGTAPDQVVLSGTATVNAAGAFTGSIASPGPGSYVVVAKACYGSGNCGLSSTTLTI